LTTSRYHRYRDLSYAENQHTSYRYNECSVGVPVAYLSSVLLVRPSDLLISNLILFNKLDDGDDDVSADCRHILKLTRDEGAIKGSSFGPNVVFHLMH